MTRGPIVAAIVTGVVRQALADAGAATLVLLDDGSPEAMLAGDWCSAALGANFVALARGERFAEFAWPLAGLPASALTEEARRLEGRLLARGAVGGALLANAVNKTALLLADAPAPEPLLPLGDLYATDVRELAGGWSAPAAVCELAEQAGGVDALDSALRAHFDERRALEEALARLPAAARASVARALAAARCARRCIGLVPKLGPRTLGLDLFD